jgi:hypothetical protein
LMTRSLEKAEAESMLLEAFGEEAISRIEDDVLAEALRRPFRAWLARERAAGVGGGGEVASMESVP